MKVSFTAKEYARILELAYLGLRVASSGSDAPDVLPERYADAAQKLFALATPLGCADLVEEVAEGEFQPSEKLESEALLEKITRFEEDSFWRELVERLAERDLPPALAGLEGLAGPAVGTVMRLPTWRPLGSRMPLSWSRRSLLMP